MMIRNLSRMSKRNLPNNRRRNRKMSNKRRKKSPNQSNNTNLKRKRKKKRRRLSHLLQRRSPPKGNSQLIGLMKMTPRAKSLIRSNLRISLPRTLRSL